MNITKDNIVFVTIAAYPDWTARTEIIRRSAKKCGINLTMQDTGKFWQGFYQHKILNLLELCRYYKQFRKDIQYILVTDARDVVYVKPITALIDLMNTFDDSKVWFNADAPGSSWPFRDKFFADAIENVYGVGGIVNGGVYVGSIDRLIEMYENAVLLHDDFLEGTISASDIVKKVYDISGTRHINDDQFFLQLMQANGYAGIGIDNDRVAFACFNNNFPINVKGRDDKRISNGPLPIGTAGILHSPWVIPKLVNDVRYSKYRSWAIRENIL